MKLYFTENKYTGCVRVFVDNDYDYGYWFNEDHISEILTNRQFEDYLNGIDTFYVDDKLQIIKECSATFDGVKAIIGKRFKKSNE